MLVELCPTSFEIWSLDMPWSESDTKLCRSSRGTHRLASKPARRTTLRNSRRTLAASSAVFASEQKTRSSSFQSRPFLSRQMFWDSPWRFWPDQPPGGVSLRALGAAVGMTASRVQEIINGKRHVSNIDVFERIADALEIPGHQLGLAPRPWESSARVLTLSTTSRGPAQPQSIATPGLPWYWDAAPTAEAIYVLTRSDLMLDRRQATRTIAVTFGLSLIDPVQRWISGPVTALPARSAATGESRRKMSNDWRRQPRHSARGTTRSAEASPAKQ